MRQRGIVSSLGTTCLSCSYHHPDSHFRTRKSSYGPLFHMYPRREKMSEKEKMNTQNKKEISGFLKGVEIIGNKLPHPAMLFLLLAVIVVIISHFVAAQASPSPILTPVPKPKSPKKPCPCSPRMACATCSTLQPRTLPDLPLWNSPCSHARCRCC